jgi:hypothetical protein
MLCERCGAESPQGETYTLFGGGKIGVSATGGGAVRTITTTYGNFKEFSVFYCTACVLAKRKFWLFLLRAGVAGGAVGLAALVYAVTSLSGDAQPVLVGISIALLLLAAVCGGLLRGFLRDPARVLKGVCERKIRKAFGLEYVLYTPENFALLQRSHRPLLFPAECCRCNDRVGDKRLDLGVTWHDVTVAAPICSQCLTAIHNDDEKRAPKIRLTFLLGGLTALVVEILVARAAAALGAPSDWVGLAGAAMFTATIVVTLLVPLKARGYARIAGQRAAARFHRKGFRFGNPEYQRRFNALNTQ